MRAVGVLSHDGPAGVRLIDVAAPASEHGVRIKVAAAGLAYPDLLHATGAYQVRHPLPRVLGSDVAGVVLSDPTGRFTVGERVMGVAMGGAAADIVVVDPDHLVGLPDQFSFEDGAAFSTNYLTAHYALARRARVQPGEKVLVHGAAGGLGTALCQVARLLDASRVTAVVSTNDKAETALRAGATDCLLVGDALDRAAPPPVPFDVIADPVGAQRLVTGSLRLLRSEGRYLVLGFAGGAVPNLEANRLLLRNVSAIGVDWGGRAATVSGFVQDQLQQLSAMMAQRPDVLVPVVGHVYDAADASAALTLIEAREARGKVVLRF